MTTTTQDQLEGLGTYKFGWADSDVAGASARRGLSEEVVRDISARKNEPEWVLDMQAGRELGRAARRHQEHLRPARHPRGGKAKAHRGRGRPV